MPNSERVRDGRPVKAERPMAGDRATEPLSTAERSNLRVAGMALVGGGLLWQPMLGIEKLVHLDERSQTWQWFANQSGFLVAMALLFGGLVALDRAHITGPGRAGRVAMHVLVVAWGLLVIGQVISLVTGWDSPLLIVGGLLTYPAALVAGTAVVRAARLTGWRGWTLLIEGVYETAFILVPLLVANWGPNWATEAGWQLCWVLVGVAALRAVGVPSATGSTTPAVTPMMGT